ncbi:MAG: FAD-dependent oxidoreductase, partial [Rubrobacteraceae bacterium]
AIQDEVVAANVPAGPLRECQQRVKNLDTRYLAAVQRQRELPTRLIQALQTFIQRRVLASALRSNQPFTPPEFVRILLRLPVLRSLPARIVGYGFWPVRVKK